MTRHHPCARWELCVCVVCCVFVCARLCAPASTAPGTRACAFALTPLLVLRRVYVHTQMDNATAQMNVRICLSVEPRPHTHTHTHTHKQTRARARMNAYGHRVPLRVWHDRQPSNGASRTLRPGPGPSCTGIAPGVLLSYRHVWVPRAPPYAAMPPFVPLIPLPAYPALPAFRRPFWWSRL